MNINNEEQARQAIEVWRADPPMLQKKNLRLAVESVELSQMYYEQKGNDQGLKRAIDCEQILRARICELEQESGPA